MGVPQAVAEKQSQRARNAIGVAEKSSRASPGGSWPSTKAAQPEFERCRRGSEGAQRECRYVKKAQRVVMSMLHGKK